MKNIHGLTIALLLLSSFNHAHAGSCVNCVVESIGTGPGFDRECPSGACALIRVKPKGEYFVRDACSITDSWHFALDTSTDTGKITLNQLMQAYESGKRIVITGNNKCSVYSSGTIEDADRVYFYWKKNGYQDPNQPYSYW